MESQPNKAEVAQALILALKYNLLGHESVRSWVDGIIASSDKADPWMLDLSFCTANDAAFCLRNVPGRTRMQNIHNILFGMAYDAHQAGALDAYGLRDVGWAAYVDEPDAPPDHWGLTLDLAIETQIDGYATIIDVDSAVAETLERLKPFVESVPTSLRRG